MAQNDVSMAQKAKALTMTKKTGDPRARPQDRDATSEISSTGSMRKTAKGTKARMTKEMPAWRASVFRRSRKAMVELWK